MTDVEDRGPVMLIVNHDMTVYEHSHSYSCLYVDGEDANSHEMMNAWRRQLKSCIFKLVYPCDPPIDDLEFETDLTVRNYFVLFCMDAPMSSSFLRILALYKFMYCIAWHRIASHHIVSYRIGSDRIVLYCIVLYCIVLYCVLMTAAVQRNT